MRLAEGLSTKFSLYNPNSSEVEVCLFLYFGELRHTYPTKTLGANQYADVDLLKAHRAMLADEFGRAIPPPGVEVGQAKILLHRGNVEKRLEVLSLFGAASKGTHGRLSKLLRVSANLSTGCSPSQ